MDKQSKKKHHYNPKCYLKNFLAKGAIEIAVFDKKNKYTPYYKKTPKNIMFEDDFYSFINLEDELDRCAETDIFELIDNDIAGVFEKIRKLDLGDITNEEYGLLTQFVVLQWLRSPKVREELFDYLSTRGVKFSKEEIRQVWLRGSFEQAPDMMDFALKLPSLFIISPENHKFITSDAPYTTEIDISDSNIQRFIPLSSRVGFLMMDGHEETFSIRINYAEKEQVQILNERVIKNTVRYIVGESESLLREHIGKSKD